MLISSIPDSYEAIKKYHGLESVIIPETGCFVQDNKSAKTSFESNTNRNFHKPYMTLMWVGKFDFRKRLDIALWALATVANPNVSTDLVVGNNVLFAGRVCFIGREDHLFDEVGKTIWNSGHRHGESTVIGDDVWLGHRVTVIGPVRIGSGSVVAAGAVVTKDIPECEVWGGVPARKLRDRFKNEIEKQRHLEYLKGL